MRYLLKVTVKDEVQLDELLSTLTNYNVHIVGRDPLNK